jgi:hypothetical protein
VPLTVRNARGLIRGIALGAGPGARRSVRGAPDPLGELRREHARWWSQRNVLGLCLARKLSETGQPLAIQVLVRRKIARGLARQLVVPRELDGGAAGIRGRVLTDVREVGRGRLDVLVSTDVPTQPGFNIGGAFSGSGTITCAVQPRGGAGRLGLSCGHVIARFGQAKPGDPVLLPSTDKAVSLGLPAASPFGQLVSVLPIGFDDADAATNVDAATFRPARAGDLDASIAVLGVRPRSVRTEVPIDLPVRKVGYATELTFGAVQALHVVAVLPYPSPDGTRSDAVFADQIGVTSFTRPGDSGALVLDESGAAVGMHIGGFDGMSICTPMTRVLDAVGCRLA